jgi:hypothetical protein
MLPQEGTKLSRDGFVLMSVVRGYIRTHNLECVVVESRSITEWISYETTAPCQEKDALDHNTFSVKDSLIVS